MILDIFFGKISFPGQTVNFAYSMSYIFWKLLFKRLILAINKSFLNILRGVRFLLTQWDAFVNLILHCVMTVANIHPESGWQVFHFVSMFQGLIEGESKVLKSLEIVFPFSLFSSLQLLSLFCKINFWLWCRVLKRNVKYVLGSKSGKL